MQEQLQQKRFVENEAINNITVRVRLDDLEDRVRETGIRNILPFLESDVFADNRFVYVETERMIVREFTGNNEEE